MDHLPLPSAPVIKSLAIPFLSIEQYDGGDFINYPSRAGWHVPESDSPYLLTRHGRQIHGDREVGAFLQIWLYFGLLFQITNQRVDPSLFQNADFTGGPQFSSVPLSNIVSEWSVKALGHLPRANRRQPDGRFEAWVAECYSLLNHANDALDRIFHAYEKKQHSIVRLIGLSIAALGDYLDQAIASIAVQRGYHDDDFPVWTLPESLCQPVTEKMQRFCPNRVYSFLTNGITAGVLWYVANLEPPQVHDLHLTCSTERCNSLHIDQHQYKIKHLDEDCFCGFQQLARPQLVDIVQNGSIALFTVHEIRGQLRIALHDQRQAQQYVAISSIWADGHGNLDSNALPSCFLRKLQSDVDALGLTPGAPTPIWIDTLCLPGHPLELRRKAVLRLSDIFRQATGILVVDSYLQTVTCSDVSQLEVLARASLSSWTSRLWTFSEGQLARQIWLQLRDTAIDLHRYISA